MFFDYFPANAEEMAIRPEEQLEELDHEEYKLRIQRTRLAEVLAVALEVEPDVVSTRDRLLQLVRERLTSGS